MCFLDGERGVAPSILRAYVQGVSPGCPIHIATYSWMVVSRKSSLLSIDQGSEFRFRDKIRMSGVADMAVVSGRVELGEGVQGVFVFFNVVVEQHKPLVVPLPVEVDEILVDVVVLVGSGRLLCLESAR